MQGNPVESLKGKSEGFYKLQYGVIVTTQFASQNTYNFLANVNIPKLQASHMVELETPTTAGN